MASPLLNFALIGRKSSGKTCLLTALASPRLVNAQGINCDLSRSKDRYNEYLNQEIVKEFFKLSDSKDTATYEEMLATIDKQKNELTKNQLPNATSLSSKAAYIYNFDTKEKIHFDLGIFDYAGELVDAESKLSDNLKSVLGKMSALMILVDIGEDDKENLKKTSLEMSNLQQFFKSLESSGQGDARFNIPIALILTKIDKYLEIKNKTYLVDPTYPDNLLKQLESTEQYTNLSSLINSIESCTEPGMFKVFAVSSFGELDENGNVDFPLKSFNILEPFKWAAEKWANNTVNKLLAELGSKGKIGMTLSCLAKDYNKELSVAISLLPKDSKLYSDGQELSKKISSSGATGLISLLAIILVAGLGLEFLFDYSHIFGLRNKELTLQNASERIEWLNKYIDAPIYRHRTAKAICLNSTEAIEVLKNTETNYNHLQWLTSFNQLQDTVNGLEKGYVDSLNNPNIIEEIAICLQKLKTTQKSEYNMEEKLALVERKYEAISYEVLKRETETAKGSINTKLSNSKPGMWIDALKTTWNLRDKPGMDEKNWKEFASEIVMQKFYDNYDRYIKEKIRNKDVDTIDNVVKELEKANTSDMRRNILQTIGYLGGEETWFERHIRNLKILAIQEEYAEILALSQKARIDFLPFLKEITPEFTGKLSRLKLRLDAIRELHPYAIDIADFKDFTDGVLNRPQKVEFYVKSIKLSESNIFWSDRKFKLEVNHLEIINQELDMFATENILSLDNATGKYLVNLYGIADIIPDVNNRNDLDLAVSVTHSDLILKSNEESYAKKKVMDFIKASNEITINIQPDAEQQRGAFMKFFKGEIAGQVVLGTRWVNPSFELFKME